MTQQHSYTLSSLCLSCTHIHAPRFPQLSTACCLTARAAHCIYMYVQRGCRRFKFLSSEMLPCGRKLRLFLYSLGVVGVLLFQHPNTLSSEYTSTVLGGSRSQQTDGSRLLRWSNKPFYSIIWVISHLKILSKVLKSWQCLHSYFLVWMFIFTSAQLHGDVHMCYAFLGFLDQQSVDDAF